MNIDKIANQKTYRRYSKYYDFIFGRIFQPGRCTAINLINQNVSSNANVLEVGIGTGLSLPLYRSDIQITGIDLSNDMLDLAHKKVNQLNLSQNVKLMVMDVEKLSFADASFNAIVALYVASVVPNITLFLNEVCRVAKPNADIFILNHFASENLIMRFLEQKLARFHRDLGFHTDLSLKRLLEFPNFKLIHSYPTNLFGYWKLLHFKNH